MIVCSKSVSQMQRSTFKCACEVFFFCSLNAFNARTIQFSPDISKAKGSNAFSCANKN